MPVETMHDLNCQRPCCVAVRKARAERRLLATMTFAERKAYRIAKRPTGGSRDGE